MVIGSGIDIVKVKRIEKILAQRKEGFYNKIFTEREIKYISSKVHSPETVSGLFASKEAIAKALGRGIGKVRWKDIEIYHDKFGKPKVALYNEGKKIMDRLGIKTIHLSISHEKDYAIAMALGFGHRTKASYERSEPLLPKRKSNSHKGNYGRVAVIAGSKGMVGSACLVSMAILRTGSGLVYNLVPESLWEVFSIKLTEAIILPLVDKNMGHFILECQKDMEGLLEDKDVLALGPGLGVDSGRIKLVEHILLNYKKPIVLDADGINCIAKNPSILQKRLGHTVITPHPGEMARLLNISIDKLQKNRLEYSKAFSNKHKVITVLKGHKTIVTNGKDVYINPTGNPGMATAGSGDVLTGIIASLIGQGLEEFKAAKLGVYIHGLAGDLSKLEKGEYGVIARDLVENIPLAIKEGKIFRKKKDF